MSGPKHIFFLMNHVFWGFGASVAYLVAASGLLLAYERPSLQVFIEIFTIDFNGIISGGLIAGAALLIYKTQHFVPAIVESVFSAEELAKTCYLEQRRRFFSPLRSTEFCAEFFLVGFIIFWGAGFPSTTKVNYILILYGALQYAGGVYVGRKLFYIAQMLNEVGNVNIDKDIFSDDLLGGVMTYVNAISAMTMIFTYTHVTFYYNGPFLYNSFAGESVKIFLLLPGVIATPVVVLFNFYPRTILRKLYLKSIRHEIDRIKRRLHTREISQFERLSYLVEYDKLAQDELRNRLRTNLSDLPVLVTLVIMIIQVVNS